jgi:hypothetical protein
MGDCCETRWIVKPLQDKYWRWAGTYRIKHDGVYFTGAPAGAGSQLSGIVQYSTGPDRRYLQQAVVSSQMVSEAKGFLENNMPYLAHHKFLELQNMRQQMGEVYWWKLSIWKVNTYRRVGPVMEISSV